MIDGGVFIGRNPSTGAEFSAADLSHHLRTHQAALTIASSYKAIFFDDKEGDDELLALAERVPGIVPAITFNPRRYAEGCPKSNLAALRDRGVKVFAVFEKPYYYETDWFSPLLKDAAHKAASLGFVLQFGVKNEQGLSGVLQNFSDIKAPVLIRWMGGGAYRALAESVHAARKFPHFYFDVASLTGVGMISYFVKSVGADRLYWASNAPEQFSFAGRFVLEAAGLSAQERDLILGGTLAAVLREDRGGHTPAFAPFKKWSALPKIDTHWHLDHWNLIEPGKHEKDFPDVFKRNAIRKTVFSSIRALNGEMVEGNRSAFAFAKKTRGTYALIVVDPTRPKETLNEIRRYSKNTRCAGLKTIQDLYNLRLDGAAYQPFLNMAEKEDLAVMAHLPGMAEAARRHPSVRFIAAHATYERAKKLFGLSNVWFDLATSHRDAAETSWKRFIREAGDDRILFASDAPLMDPAWTAGKLAESGFTPRQLRKIFSENAGNAFPRLK